MFQTLTRSLVSVGLVTLSVASFIGYCRYKTKCKCKKQYFQEGFVLIIGSAPGIALETAMEVIKRRGHVILANKSVQEALEMRRKIQRKFGVKTGLILIQELDFASCASIKKFLLSIKRAVGTKKIAAIVNTEDLRDAPLEITADGFDKTFQINYMGPFIAYHKMQTLLYEFPGFRIITLSGGQCCNLSLDDVGRPLKDPSNVQSYGNNAYQISKVCTALMSMTYWASATLVEPRNLTLSERCNPWKSWKEPYSGLEGVLHALFKPNRSSDEDIKRTYSYISPICVQLLEEQEMGKNELKDLLHGAILRESLRHTDEAMKDAAAQHHENLLPPEATFTYE